MKSLGDILMDEKRMLEIRRAIVIRFGGFAAISAELLYFFGQDDWQGSESSEGGSYWVGHGPRVMAGDHQLSVSVSAQEMQLPYHNQAYE